uniref:Uncharacterized protein n=1 Tax=Opuntia streptacantha TaxID=393608 RepID=A0A7C9A7J3_OPUST
MTAKDTKQNATSKTLIPKATLLITFTPFLNDIPNPLSPTLPSSCPNRTFPCLSPPPPTPPEPCTTPDEGGVASLVLKRTIWWWRGGGSLGGVGGRGELRGE